MGRNSPREEEGFRGHTPEECHEQQMEEKEGGGRTAQSGEPGERKEEDAEEEDAGQNWEKPEPHKRVRAERGGETKPAMSVKQHGESNTTGQSRHVPGGTWLNKVPLYLD
ncbi:hypothetical protein NDU88_007690 [Pleurodeles waltl]|uniref:Uncharacterized protein n=1 Tax=Pleurodeles waltl TaxID=8319 RepID=A0AAV7N2W9_PLEWA|nr:hypothetical protein NDU88_007690 [Pleurodeles waltl]